MARVRGISAFALDGGATSALTCCTNDEPVSMCRPMPLPARGTWRCEYCGSLHPARLFKCCNCGASRQREQDAEEDTTDYWTVPATNYSVPQVTYAVWL